MDIREEIFALLDSLNCEREIRDGIVFVKTPDGQSWDFTVPCSPHFGLENIYPFEVAVTVRALCVITEGGEPEKADPKAEFPTAGFIHANPGDIGVVVGIDDNTPTIRFWPSGHATIVGMDEVEFLMRN